MTRPWLVGYWTGQLQPLPIHGPAELHAAIDAVYGLIGTGDVGEILRLQRADGAELEVWLDVPARGGWAFSYRGPDGRYLLSGSGTVREDEPELDFRFYDAWNSLPVSSFVPAGLGRRAIEEYAATGALPSSVPWRAG